jgi:hypothetical protein
VFLPGVDVFPTTEVSFMIGTERNTGPLAVTLNNLAAAFTDAAYTVALRHAKPGSWLDLELDLWRALSETAQRWERGIASHLAPQHIPPRSLQPQVAPVVEGSEARMAELEAEVNRLRTTDPHNPPWRTET